MRLPRFRLRTLIAVVLGAGLVFAAIRACPWLSESILIGSVITAVSAVVAAFVMVAVEGVVAFIGAAARVVAAARPGRRPDRREGDLAPPGSD